MMRDLDLTGYYRLLAVVCPPIPKAARAPKPERPTVALVYRPTLDRSEARGLPLRAFDTTKLECEFQAVRFDQIIA